MKKWIRYNAWEILIVISFVETMLILMIVKLLSTPSEPQAKVEMIVEPIPIELDIKVECTCTEYEEEPTIEIDTWKSLGNFMLTAYCPCEKCCGKCTGITASGTQATEGRTIAVDTSIIPHGTVVKINDHEYIAEDTGSKINKNHIDIYFENHQDAVEFGVQEAEVFIKE